MIQIQCLILVCNFFLRNLLQNGGYLSYSRPLLLLERRWLPITSGETRTFKIKNNKNKFLNFFSQLLIHIGLNYIFL